MNDKGQQHYDKGRDTFLKEDVMIRLQRRVRILKYQQMADVRSGGKFAIDEKMLDFSDDVFSSCEDDLTSTTRRRS